ncbi:hypothetical protein K505DRAFT_326633 [Melanomma pulvis-pyrius CBS 109.77]|uniref:Inositol-pentakisphosphate 2-kinase n=1 Tax=Melanomma pulvis-pyrius CBS 109.77 TaxID=1314802 RepID=A0A6A6X5I4_9PLEO|nr:hypothetical protein K505DRAFT_326633 [Melanomma pulvis-pyrius CBS 109.77]
MLYQETVSVTKMQEPSFDDGDTKVLRQESPTHKISFIERNDQEHYSPDMPGVPSVCCRTTEDPYEIQQAGFYVRYLAEGAANVVFTIHKWTEKVTHRKPLVFVSGFRRERLYGRGMFIGKVLRISKGHAKTGSCQEIMDGFEKNIRPLFASPSDSTTSNSGSDSKKVAPYNYRAHLMNYEPITLTKDVVEELTNEIDEQSSRHENLSIPIMEQTGILLPDMTSQPKESVTIEIKPKWLQQSPNAPRDAYRCRTCALETSRSAKDKKPTYICPLQLLTGNATLIQPYIRRKVVKAVAGFRELQPTSNQIDLITNRITKYLTTGHGHTLLQHLRHTQIQLDPKGIRERDVHKNADPTFEANLQLAMTMRDCSMYIKAAYSDHYMDTSDLDSDAEIECKLGDLDSKSPEKLDDWDKKEKGLINGAWYTRIDPDLERLHHEECLVSAGWKKYVPHHW